MDGRYQGEGGQDTPHRKLELSIFIGKDPIGGRSFALNITS